jgi:hypothetical protein
MAVAGNKGDCQAMRVRFANNHVIRDLRELLLHKAGQCRAVHLYRHHFPVPCQFEIAYMKS